MPRGDTSSHRPLVAKLRIRPVAVRIATAVRGSAGGRSTVRCKAMCPAEQDGTADRALSAGDWARDFALLFAEAFNHTLIPDMRAHTWAALRF